MSDLLKKLRERFHPSEIRTRRQGGKDLQYVDIASVIERFLDTLEGEWSWRVIDSSITPIEQGGYLASVTGEIHVGDIVRSGVGADVANDADKAYKTALAEAFKKAANYFGVGLELWDEDVRNSNERVMKGYASDDLSTLKTAVFELALMGGADPSAEGVADYFGVSVEALQDSTVLREILERQPVTV